MMNKATRHKTTCSYCGVGCGIEVSKDRKGMIELNGDENHPVNKGMLCSKGRNLHYTVMDHSDRLMNPQMRWGKDHPLEDVSWDTALTRASAVFTSLIKNFGPDSVGFYVSGQCLTEEYYLINKLTKGYLGTNNIDTNSRLCMSSAVAGYVKTLGEDSVPVSYEDIELADCFFITGANPAWCHPILFRRIEKHKEENPNVKIIVVDPRETQTCAQADLHLQINPGTDHVLYHAIGRILIENGDIDQDFIANHTEGIEGYRNTVMSTSVEKAAGYCGVSEKKIRLAAEYIAESKGFLTLWAMGINQSTSGVSKNVALISLNLITGHIGKPGSGPLSLTGQPNAMGGREVGGMANLLAAHRDQSNPLHQKEVADFWGVQGMPQNPGLTATQMFEALESGKMKAIWIICTNPSVSLPNARLVDAALRKAKFVIVQDISKNSDTLPFADLVLPAASWLEKEGTMTNSERRISYLPKVVDAPGEALPDAEIIIQFAKKMGYDGFDFPNMAAVYKEHCELTKGTNIDISGLSYERLQTNGTIQWPVPSVEHLGTQRLFTDHKFYTLSQKANIMAGTISVENEGIDDDFPLILTTGRIRDQWHTMTRTGKVNKLKKHLEKPFLEMHSFDASKRGMKNGDIAVIRSRRGEVRVRLTVTEKIKPGVIFLPMHWGKTLSNDQTRANNLTDRTIDPVSKQPGFKFAAVEVLKYKKSVEKIVIVGAGAAAFRFINTYRKLNEHDELHVFSKEEYPFYNRVLLPEYINETLSWEDLLKFKYGELEKLNIHMHVGNSIEKLDRATKTVIDAKGESHSYDKLILATGSRAFVPADVPIHLPGVFTMRDRHNADELKKYISQDGKVLIVGGGLLGLELAASLREIGVDITIIQLGSRLMQRQLDHLASNLLREKMEEMGVDIFTNDQVQSLDFKNDQSIDAYLKSGKTVNCSAVVYAIGTQPNIELAKNADIACGRGIIVNEYLQSEDPNVFAMGEIAELNQMLNGITSAAEQQADCMANFFAGDISSTYHGSISMNILKIADFDLCSIGLPDVPTDGKGYEEILFIDQVKLYYKKCLIKEDRLVGAILMGDKSEFAEFKRLIEDKTELSEKRLELLRSGKTADPVIGVLVCSCNNVGEGNLRKAIDGGAETLASVCEMTGAGLGCGSCKPEVQNLIDLTLSIPVTA